MNKPVEINPDWVDIDFAETQPDNPDFAGCLDPFGSEPEPFGVSWPSGVPVLKSNEWAAYKQKQKDELGTDRPGRLYLEPHNDQSPESSCVLNATEVAFRFSRNKAIGKMWEMKISPMWMYQYICSGRHSGSYTMDAMRFITETGGCPESSSAKSQNPSLTLCHRRATSLCPYTYHQNTPYEGKRKYEIAKNTAKYFRVTQWITLQGDDQFATALLYGWPIVNGRSGHSICHCDLIQDGRNWYSEYLDSYDSDRGDNGRLYDTQRMWTTSGAWAAASVVIPDNPLLPCGPDSLTLPTVEEYYALFPDAPKESVLEYFNAI